MIQTVSGPAGGDGKAGLGVVAVLVPEVVIVTTKSHEDTEDILLVGHIAVLVVHHPVVGPTH